MVSQPGQAGLLAGFRSLVSFQLVSQQTSISFFEQAVYSTYLHRLQLNKQYSIPISVCGYWV